MPQETGARVIVMRGTGADKLSEAITAGILDVDAQRAAERVLQENRMLESENRWLQRQLESMKMQLNRLTEAQIAAYGAYFDRKKKAADRYPYYMWLYALAFAAGISIATVFATIMILG